MQEFLAALDIGSNSVVLMLAQAAADGNLLELNESCRVTRLGQGVDSSGKLDEAAVARTLAAVRELAASLPENSHGRGVAATTSAVRDAANGAGFLDACAEIIGARPLIMAGTEEAATGFAGAATAFAVPGFTVNIDVGGGSTEIAAGHFGKLEVAESLDIGCVRFAERYDLFEIPRPTNLNAAGAAAYEALMPVCRLVLNLRRPELPMLITASSGTAVTFASVCLGNDKFERRAVHGFRATPAQLSECLTRLYALTSRERLEVPGIMPARAPVLPTGLLILHQAVQLLGADSFTVNTKGLRFGMLLKLLQGQLQANWHW